MIVLSNSAAQTLEPGQAIVFDRVVQKSGCGECHKDGSPSVRLKGNLYEVAFTGNIGSVAAGPAQISIQNGGETLPETTRITPTAAAGDLSSVATDTVLEICCCDYSRLTVVNTGTAAITVGPGTAFKIVRKS